MASVSEDLWQLSASELSAAYAEGLSPRDVLESTLARIAKFNSGLNAIVTIDDQGARRAAEASTRRWAEGRPLSPLDGAPITVKDNIFVGGIHATWGSRLFEDHIPDADEEPVARMRAAGAVIIGKTNVPEFTVHGYTDNALFGTTRNPWDVSLTPGGSSGGAVAAVASGMGVLALGTDGGGSIRRPAAHTGLVGFKPSRDMVPRGGGFPAILNDFEVIGPIARCVGDVILAMDVIGGPQWRAPTHPLSATRIAFAQTFHHAPVDPFIRSVLDQTIATTIPPDVEVDRIESFDLAAPLDRIWSIISQTGVAWLLSKHPERRHLVSPAIAAMADAGSTYSASDYLEALDTIARLNAAFSAFFARYNFLLTPTTAATPWAADHSHPTHIDGHAVGPRGHAVFTPIANALGLPAISLPCVVNRSSLPVGLQIIAPRGHDREVLAFANRLMGDRHYQWPQLA
jgi:aspartyl-tRNA(Asn)/glutamyl-tRNA(Gln) amidotransferase subunit A